ncbi:MAG TPA: DUF4476 domain-containing protein [Edaphocola sp.]|nr:DUF4476 domain-containing protein [Edaphocola sp.]
MKRIALVVLFFVLSGSYAVAQNDYSYFYFEGDQQTPFYVKVEGKMQPRYGQNHFIIPDLAEGYTHFEILFQQNEYPPQKFFLEVPGNGFRGFVLHKINDEQFALLDLQQQKYIPADNTKEEGAAGMLSPLSDASPAVTPAFKPASETGRDKRRRHEDMNGRLALLAGDTVIRLSDNNDTVPAGREQKMTADGSFLNGIVLNGNNNEINAKTDGSLPPVPNTDCPNAMSNEEFEGFALKLLDRDGDDNRLKYLKKQLNIYCFSTEQVRIIAKNLTMQSSRYEAVKMLYRHTSDQENYSRLESLFNTPFLKEKFNAILHP